MLKPGGIPALRRDAVVEWQAPRSRRAAARIGQALGRGTLRLGKARRFDPTADALDVRRRT